MGQIPWWFGIIPLVLAFAVLIWGSFNSPRQRESWAKDLEFVAMLLSWLEPNLGKERTMAQNIKNLVGNALIVGSLIAAYNVAVEPSQQVSLEIAIFVVALLVIVDYVLFRSTLLARGVVNLRRWCEEEARRRRAR